MFFNWIAELKDAKRSRLVEKVREKERKRKKESVGERESQKEDLL